MIAHDRRDNNDADNGRRKLTDRRRSNSGSYNGIEQRNGIERRTLLDRRR